MCIASPQHPSCCPMLPGPGRGPRYFRWLAKLGCTRIAHAMKKKLALIMERIFSPAHSLSPRMAAGVKLRIVLRPMLPCGLPTRAFPDPHLRYGGFSANVDCPETCLVPGSTVCADAPQSPATNPTTTTRKNACLWFICQPWVRIRASRGTFPALEFGSSTDTREHLGKRSVAKHPMMEQGRRSMKASDNHQRMSKDLVYLLDTARERSIRDPGRCNIGDAEY